MLAFILISTIICVFLWLNFIIIRYLDPKIDGYSKFQKYKDKIWFFTLKMVFFFILAIFVYYFAAGGVIMVIAAILTSLNTLGLVKI